MIKKIVNKIKELWDKFKTKLGEIYKAAEKWIGVFILGHKLEAIVLFLTSFAFIVDMTAGTRFNAFFAPVLIGLLGRSIVIRDKQATQLKEAEAKLLKAKKK